MEPFFAPYGLISYYFGYGFFENSGGIISIIIGGGDVGQKTSLVVLLLYFKYIVWESRLVVKVKIVGWLVKVYNDRIKEGFFLLLIVGGGLGRRRLWARRCLGGGAGTCLFIMGPLRTCYFLCTPGLLFSN